MEGEVQKVGYRDFVVKVARRLGVRGYVESVEDGSVQILCEVDDSVLKDFVEQINVKEEFMVVENVRVVEKCEAAGEFQFFKIKYGRLEDELGERMGTAVEFARATNQTIKAMHEDVKGTRSDIKAMHEDVKGTRADIKAMHEDLKESIGVMHVDLKESIGSMHKDVATEVVGVREEIGGMRCEMNERFDEMAKRYDVISEELVRTREELTRAVDGLLKVIEEFIHQQR